MAQKFLTSIDLAQNELQNAVAHNAPGVPSASVKEGTWYWDSTNHKLYINNSAVSGTTWHNLMPGTFTTTVDGYVPKTTTSNTTDFLRRDGTWAAPPAGSGTVTSVAALTLGTTGTDLSSTVANGTTTPVITLQVPTASAANRGALSSADWSTFNGAATHAAATTGNQHGSTTVGANFLRLTNPGAITFPRINADNTVTALSAASFLTAIGGIGTDTNYYPTTFTWSAGTTAGPTGSLTGSGMSAVSYAAIPAASSTASGIVTTGAQNFAGSKTFDNDVIFTGNITVNGTTTSVNTETVTINDNILVLNNNEAGTPSQDAGLEVERGTSTNVQLIYKESVDQWQATNDGTNYHAITRKYVYPVATSATSYVITHNLNTRDIHVAVFQTATPWAQVMVDVEATSVNTATIRFNVAPTAGDYTATIIG